MAKGPSTQALVVGSKQTLQAGNKRKRKKITGKARKRQKNEYNTNTNTMFPSYKLRLLREFRYLHFWYYTQNLWPKIKEIQLAGS